MLQVLWFLIVVSFAAYVVFLATKPSVWLAKGHKWGDKSTHFQIFYHAQADRTSKKLSAASGPILNNVVLQIVSLDNAQQFASGLKLERSNSMRACPDFCHSSTKAPISNACRQHLHCTTRAVKH